jgi:formate hydrogenlyase transcriptional activator
MNTTIDELAAPAGEELAWMRPRLDVFESTETESVIDDHRRGDSVQSTRPRDQSLLKLLYELVVGMPAMAGVQALRVWLCSPENGSVRLQLLMDDLPEKPGAGMELPLDDSIARWVWQHQRPLVIAAEDGSSFPDFARLLMEWGIKYFCAVPLMFANRRIGVLGLASTSREALRSFDLEFVRRGVANLPKATKDDDELQDLAEAHEGSRGGTARLEEDAPFEDNFEGIIGRSAVISALGKQIKIVAPTGSTALILGETGTGKELIARAIHNLSPRRNRPFIKVNCAAIPAGLIESELFGHERGAFTGAVVRRTGRFEMADGGTLFLDEIGDIPLELQPKLLRVLQEQEFERIGSTQTTRVNVRIVAATSRDLPRMVAAREFRADLYYRLNVFPLRVPALRERSEDIPLLVRHFVELYSGKTSKRVTDVPTETMEVLLRYPWPGNVRELQNVIERAVILSPGRVLRPSLDELQPSSQMTDAAGAQEHDDPTTLKDMEREHIVKTLAATKWVLGGPKGAGVRLGLPRTTLIAKMQKLGISRALA